MSFFEQVVCCHQIAFTKWISGALQLVHLLIAYSIICAVIHSERGRAADTNLPLAFNKMPDKRRTAACPSSPRAAAWCNSAFLWMLLCEMVTFPLALHCFAQCISMSCLPAPSQSADPPQCVALFVPQLWVCAQAKWSRISLRLVKDRREEAELKK